MLEASDIHFNGCATTQAVSCQLVTGEAQVQSQGSSCGICSW